MIKQQGTAIIVTAIINKQVTHAVTPLLTIQDKYLKLISCKHCSTHT